MQAKKRLRVGPGSGSRRAGLVDMRNRVPTLRASTGRCPEVVAALRAQARRTSSAMSYECNRANKGQHEEHRQHEPRRRHDRDRRLEHLVRWTASDRTNAEPPKFQLRRRIASVFGDDVQAVETQTPTPIRDDVDAPLVRCSMSAEHADERPARRQRNIHDAMLACVARHADDNLPAHVRAAVHVPQASDQERERKRRNRQTREENAQQPSHQRHDTRRRNRVGNDGASS